MDKQFITAKKINTPSKAAIACLLALLACGSTLAQYQGSAVKKEKLIGVLRSKQLQTAEIVAIIKSYGADFRLTPAVERELVAAGARPEVVEAVRDNYRAVSKDNNASPKTGSGGSAGNRDRNGARAAPAPPTYDDLVDQAVYANETGKDPRRAESILLKAVTLESRKPRAYQALGFVYLYGLGDFTRAENFWRTAIALGGSAVLRVFHDHTGNFTDTCKGSLFISSSRVRFESDNNVHTFESFTSSVDKIKMDSSSTPLFREKHSTYKIIFRIREQQMKFTFAPLTGSNEESKIAERLIRLKLSDVKL